MKRIWILVLLLFFALPVCAEDKVDNTAPQLETSISTEDSSLDEISPEYDSYIKYLQKSIKKNWIPPLGEKSLRTILLFKISKDGQLLGCKVHQSSGNEAADKAAIIAVKKTAPFEPLPKNVTDEIIDIQFTFDYNIYQPSNNYTPSTLVYKSTPNSQITQIYKSMKNREDKKVFREYLEQVGRVLSFVQYDGDKKNLVRVKFTIDKAGLVTSAKVSASSGDKDFNNAILSKVKTLEFGEIPEQLKLEELPFEIEFNNCFYYNPLSAQNYAKANTAFGAVTASSLLGLFIMSIIGF